MTTWFKPISATASATLVGSLTSSGAGNPFFTLQKAHALVQRSPKLSWTSVNRSYKRVDLNFVNYKIISLLSARNPGGTSVTGVGLVVTGG